MDMTATKVWELYEQGRAYNQRLRLYNIVETNTRFFSGDQWTNLPNTREIREHYKPVFNILKRVASLFIASMTSSGVAVHLEPLSFNADPDNAASFAEAEVENLLEKFKFEYRLRDALFDGAQTGDYAAHFYWDPDALPYGAGSSGSHRGEIRMELVDGISVMFGNPNIHSVEKQPYVILVGRDTIANLKAEKKAFRRRQSVYGGKAEDMTADITADMETRVRSG